MVVTLPFVLVLLDVWPLKRLAIERLTGTQPENTNEPRTSLKAFLRQWTHVLAPFVKEKTPFFALSAASCVVTFAVQRAGGAVVSLEHIPLDLRIENAFVSYVRYLAKTFWPADLSVYYQYPDDWPLWPVAGAVLLLLGVTALVLRQARARPWLAVGWLWYLGTLVPVIGLVQVGEQAMANRYTYLPLVGIFVMVAWTAAEWAASLRRREIFLCGAASLTLLACVWTTRAQLRHWSSGRDLFQEALRITPGDMVHINLGNALSKEGKLADAVAEYEAALRINPRHPAAHYNLGLTWAKLGRWADAAAAYTEALRYKPDFMDARNNLGVALAAQRKFDEARACYAEALRLRPGDAGALNNLGNALCAMGRLEESLDCYAQAVKSKHDYAKAQLNWGMALADLGRPAEALPHFQEAARLDPESAEAHNELARALAERGDLAPALEHYAAALKLKPDFAEAHVNLGLALLLAGKLDDARAAFTRALQLRPDYPNAHNNLAYVFAQQGRAREAVLHFSEAIRLQPDTAPALNSLAWIYATHADAQLRNGAEAVRLAERACALTKRQQPVFLGTLAAAYAEAGRFDDAVRTAREAQELATRQGLSEVAAQLSARVKSFEAGQPWRQATP
ncbi:MAG: tetratricopeptide repeat protein, partial [Verrucomicrobia bacterium]|nr:tetratricopeptide repeat protein [Verrucomicrobiota bacterium]